MEPDRKQIEQIRKLQYGGSPGCGTLLMSMLTCPAVAVLCLVLVCCRTPKESASENQDTSDSVRIEYRERVVRVPVTVYVEVPVEVKERETRDSTSFLKTLFAQSWARLAWEDGVPVLHHTLENIPQQIARTDSAAVAEKEKVVWKTRRVRYTATTVLEKRLTTWQQLKVDYGGWAMAALTAVICLLLVLLKKKNILYRF